MAKKFPSELSSRGTVKLTDKLLIHNIDTGATEFTTVAGLIAVLDGSADINLADAGEGDVTAVRIFSIGGSLYIQNGDGNYIKFRNKTGGLYAMFTNSGALCIGTVEPTSKLQVVGIAEYADNTAAVAAGLTAGAFYRTGDVLKIVHA